MYYSKKPKEIGLVLLEKFKNTNRSELPESVKKFLEKFKTNRTNPNNIFNNLFKKNEVANKID